MYTRLGQAPTTTTYDCASRGASTSESCTFTAPAAGTYYVSLYGYSAYSGVTVTASYTTNGSGITALQNGVPVTSLSGATTSSTLYSIAVPSGATNLVISTSGGTGDVDLYTRAGQVPTVSAYDCISNATGNNHSCSSSAPVAGTYYVLLYGYSAYSGVTLTASYSAGANTGGTATPTYRFNNPFTGGHFFTASEVEKAYVLANLPAYHYEGVGFYTLATQATSTLPIYRFSNSYGFHFFTISESEKSQLLFNPNYRYDGTAFYGYATQVAGSAPVYRFTNNLTGASFYTTMEAEKAYVIANLPSYIYQNIVFYVRTEP